MVTPIILDGKNEEFSKPTGKIINFAITATIIPIDIHFISSMRSLLVSNFDEKKTPENLHKKVAIEATRIAI